MPKNNEIMDFLHENVFDPILNSPNASKSLKQGVSLTIMRMNERVKWYRYSGHLEKCVIGTKLLEVKNDKKEKELFETI